MFDFLTLPGFQPFVITGLVLLGLTLVELVSLMFGHSAAGMVDHALDLNHPDVHLPELHAPDIHVPVPHGAFDIHSNPDAGGDQSFSHGKFLGSLYDWLNAGRVPLLILLMAALGAFSVAGLVLQIVAMNVAAPLPTVVAALLAFLAVIPTTRSVSRVLARFLPRDETYAVEEADLVGRTGIVTLGPVDADSAGRAKVLDPHGNAHFPRVLAGRADLVIEQGTEVLVVNRVGSALTVVPASDRQLTKSV